MWAAHAYADCKRNAECNGNAYCYRSAEVYSFTTAASHTATSAVRPAFNACSGTRDHSRVPEMRTPLGEITRSAESWPMISERSAQIFRGTFLQRSKNKTPSCNASSDGRFQARHVAPAVIGKLSGPRRRRWARPRFRNCPHRDSGSDAAKYPATSCSGKGIVSGIHGQRPNTSAHRNEAAADIGPGSTVIY